MGYTAAFWCLLIGALLMAGCFAAYVFLQTRRVQFVSKALQDAPQMDHAIQKIGPALNTGSHQILGLLIQIESHPNQKEFIHNYLKVTNYDLLVLHGVDNAEELVEAFQESARVHLVDMGISALSNSQYNYLMTRPQLYQQIPSEFLLVLHMQSVLFSQSQVKLQDYLRYDYVSVPCSWKKLVQTKWDHMLFTGNDKAKPSLSLRKVSKMKEVTEQYPYLSKGNVPEQVYFEYSIQQMKNTFQADHQTAAQLFFETVEPEALPFAAQYNIPQKHSQMILDQERKSLLQ